MATNFDNISAAYNKATGNKKTSPGYSSYAGPVTATSAGKEYPSDPANGGKNPTGSGVSFKQPDTETVTTPSSGVQTPTSPSTPVSTPAYGGGRIGETVSSVEQSKYALNDEERVRAINDMYDANINAQRIALQESGDQALSDAQANRDRIAGIYNTQRNAASVDWERQRRNFLEGANMNGINTGAGSQAELAMMGQNQRSQNALGAAQAQAETEADRNIADIARSTQASINEAVATNDYQRAAALLDEYNNMYAKYMERAQALAQFGDFSGYAAIYGQDMANQMFYSWAAQNPKLAYQMGVITDDQYRNLNSGRAINAERGAAGGSIGNGGPSFIPMFGGNGPKSQQQIFYEQYGQLLTPDANGNIDPNAAELAAQALDVGNRS